MTRRGRPVRVTALALASIIGLVAPNPFGSGVVRAVSSPVARWALDDGSGLTANDSVGTADGTVAGGATWLTSNAAVGTGAIELDGADDEITVPSGASIQPAQVLITLWVRGDPGSQPAAGQVLIEKGAFGCAGASYGLYVTADGVRFSFRSPNGYQVQKAVSEAEAKVDLWDGAWHLVAGAANYSQSAVFGMVWIDGYRPDYYAVGDILQTGQHTSAVRYTGATHDELRIAGAVDEGCSGTNFHGDVDDVRVYADPSYPPGSLMTPITSTVSGLVPTTVHPSQVFQAPVSVSPVPRWGAAYWAYMKDGAWSAMNGANLDVAGHASASLTAPATVGTYGFRATFEATPPYLTATQATTLTVTPWPTTTTVTSSPDVKLPLTTITLRASVASTPIASSPYPKGSVQFYETTSGSPVLLGAKALSWTSTGTSSANLNVTTFGAGTHKVIAKYVGPDPIRSQSTSATINVVVSKFTPTVNLSLVGSPTIETNHSFVVGASVQNAGSSYAPGATMTFRRVGSSTPICVVAVVAGAPTLCTVPSKPAGTWQFTATYSGNANTLGRTSAALTVNVIADTLHATAVGTDVTTFYPYKDSYRDTVAIKGIRDEPIGVTIKIYSPGGTLLKTVTMPSATGPYSYAWNGRNSAGTWYAEGKYKIVQTLTDGYNPKVVTSYVTLSKKRMYTYTKTIAKAGSSITAKGTLFSSTVTLNTTSGYALLKAGSGGWAGVGYELTLPTATIYKSIKFQVYAKDSSATGPTQIAVQNFTTCAYATTVSWNTSCFDHWASIGNASITTAWYTTTADVTTNRSGTKVRGTVSQSLASVYVYKAQVVVTYGVLKY